MKKFIESDSIRSLERDFLRANNYDRLHVRRVFESCEIKIENGSVPDVSILVRARDRRLAKETVEFLVKGFADMVNERNHHVLEKHTARARVQIEKAKRRGDPVPEGALREIEVVRSSLENENYRVFDVRDVKVRFYGRRWRW